MCSCSSSWQANIKRLFWLGVCLFLMGCEEKAAPQEEATIAVAAAPTLQPTVAAAPLPTQSLPMTPSPTPVPFDAQVINWLQQTSIPFDSIEPGHSCADLQPLMDMIGEARIVALGQATYGTHEFFTMNHRLTECLVQEKGFNLVAIEANWPESYYINQYVTLGRRNAFVTLSGLNAWAWNTQELVDLIEWLHLQNENGDTVSFHGFDMRDAGLAMDHVVGYLRTVDPGAVAAAARAYDCFRPYNGDPKYLVLARTCRDELAQVYQQLVNHQSIYVNLTSQRAFVAALQNARVVQQAEETLASTDLSGFKRNLFMAENIAWLLEQSEPESKLILWGHNTLLSYGDNTLGYYLRQQFGEQMVNVGFSFYQGDFNARPGPDMPPTPLTFGVPDPSSFEHIAHQTGWPRFYVDLRAVADPVGQMWLNQAIPFYGVIGMGYDVTRPLPTINDIQPAAFDIIIHIDSTTPTTLLPLLPVYAGQIIE